MGKKVAPTKPAKKKKNLQMWIQHGVGNLQVWRFLLTRKYTKQLMSLALSVSS